MTNTHTEYFTIITAHFFEYLLFKVNEITFYIYYPSYPHNTMRWVAHFTGEKLKLMDYFWFIIVSQVICEGIRFKFIRNARGDITTAPT